MREIQSNDQHPKCVRLMVTAIYADGSSGVLDIKEPKSVKLDHEEGVTAHTDLSMQAFAYGGNWTQEVIIKVRVGDAGFITSVSPIEDPPGQLYHFKS